MAVTENKTGQTHFETNISEEELKALKSINYGLNKFVSLKDKDKVNWQFNPKNIQKVTNKFGQERTRFEIYDPLLEHEFIWDAPSSAARKVMPFVTSGYLYLTIERIGADKETKYDVKVFEE